MITSSCDKILITGINGFIASALFNKLDSPVGIDGNYNEELINKTLTYFNPDVVFHVGACTNTLNTDIEYMMYNNFLATKWITDWCTLNKKKLIYSSSAACYGNNNQYPTNVYGWSKYLGELYVLQHNAIALRYFNVYGPGESHKGNMASFIYQNYKKESIGIFKGNPSRDFIHVSDVVSANLFALEHYEKIQGKYYDVGTGNSYMYEYLCNIMGKSYYYVEDDHIPKGYQFHTIADKKKIMPGWMTKILIDYGVTNYINLLNEEN